MFANAAQFRTRAQVRLAYSIEEWIDLIEAGATDSTAKEQDKADHGTTTARVARAKAIPRGKAPYGAASCDKS